MVARSWLFLKFLRPKCVQCVRSRPRFKHGVVAVGTTQMHSIALRACALWSCGSSVTNRAPDGPLRCKCDSVGARVGVRSVRRPRQTRLGARICGLSAQHHLQAEGNQSEREGPISN